MKNYKFCSIDAYFLILKSKVICQRGKTFFFHQKSEGIAFTFCRYLNQNMRAFKFCRYCLQKYFLIPSNFDEKKYHCILRAIPWEFWDEVFSLKIWGHFIQQCLLIFIRRYRIVASTNTCYYSENQLFVQRSQYIRTENPLHKQSEKAKTCH